MGKEVKNKTVTEILAEKNKVEEKKIMRISLKEYLEKVKAIRQEIINGAKNFPRQDSIKIFEDSMNGGLESYISDLINPLLESEAFQSYKYYKYEKLGNLESYFHTEYTNKFEETLENNIAQMKSLIIVEDSGKELEAIDKGKEIVEVLYHIKRVIKHVLEKDFAIAITYTKV